MSRCFPFPPPNYRREEKSLAESIKLQKERETAKDGRKEKKREKKEKKEKREKSKDKHEALEHKEHRHKKRKLEESNKLPTKDGYQKAASKEAVEQLEGSGLTEEHGLPCAVQEPSDSSGSTQNSSKSRKVEATNVGGSGHGGTILRLKLPLQKHKDPKPTPVNNEPCISGRPTSEDMKATRAMEKPCFSGRATTKDLRAGAAIDEPCSSGRVTFRDPRATPTVRQPSFSGQAISKGLRAAATIEERGSCSRPTSKNVRSTPAIEEPCFSGRASLKDLEANLATEARLCFSELGNYACNQVSEVPLLDKLGNNACNQASEVPLLDKLGNNTCNQSINIRDRTGPPTDCQLANNARDPSKSSKASEAQMDQKSDDNGHRHTSSRSKSSKRAEKQERKFRDLVMNWGPEPFILDAECGTEDLGWLFGNSGQHLAKSDAKNCSASSTVEDLNLGTGASSFQPKACYLPEFETYQLPYVVPF